MISHFFIDRPIFAAVLSIVITLAGGIAAVNLPIAQYPQITPPSVQVSINYPGASAQVVAATVAAPIEQQVNGVQGMLYMSSQMGNDGSYTLTVTFDLGVDLNTALVMVQNRVALAMPQLPNQVQQQGITIKKKTPDLLMIINFTSPDNRYDDVYLSNFAMIYVKDELFRVAGVSDITFMGQRDYSIRAWLDPQKLASRNMTASDVAKAIRSQNIEAAAGQVGQPPVNGGQTSQLPITTLGRLTLPEQFADIIVKVGQNRASGPSLAASPSKRSVGLALPGSISPIQNFSTMGGVASARVVASNIGGGVSTAPLSTATSSSGVGTATTSSSSSVGVQSISGVTGGGATGGGAMAGGGGTTAGGGASNGGGTTGGAASGGTTTNTTSGPGTMTSGATSSTMTGLTSGSMSAAGGNGTISGATMGHGPQNPSATIVRLRDVARVELGAQNYNQGCTFDGQPSVGLGIRMLPGTNALDVADRVRSKMDQLRTRFPEGVDFEIAYDITPFIRESVADVVQTLFEAVVLVGVVVMVFLQNWRAMIIPLIAVPVAIVGTFAVMLVLGFSLNNISLFGLVLAIGIVVDDAIVVVENVERWLEQGLSPRDATRKAMEEVTGPVIAVALVLCAVFVPCAFISGIIGQFFRQFAVTIAVSTVFSAINSLTLSPALAAILLHRKEHVVASADGAPRRLRLAILLRPSLLLSLFYRTFNAVFGASTTAYAWVVGILLRISVLVLLAYVGLVVLTYWVFVQAPTGFIPQQDQGRLIVNIQLPDSASLTRTREAIAQIEKISLATEGVAHTTTVAGLSFLQQANSSNFGSMFVVLAPFEERKGPAMTDIAIMARLRAAWKKEVKDAQVTVYGAPPVPGLSVAGGFKLMVEDSAGMGLATLQRQTDKLIQKMQAEPGLTGVSTQFRSNTPQLYLDIDRAKVATLGVSLDELDQTLQIYLGSLYVNSFNAFGRYWQVTLQAEGDFRDRTSDINLLQVRNRLGQMVLLGTLVNVREIGGPIFATRYNLYSAAPIIGNTHPDVSSGDAIATIDRLVAENLPLSMKAEWTELMFMQIRAGNTAMYVFALAVVCVFLALAALYESWSLPLAVILVVPLCLLCSVVGVLYTKTSVNIFVQIGLVVLVGLACKNAILIVEFARQLHEEGHPRFEATKEASRLRLRPILMTSLAFILGVVPLVVAEGAGAEMRRSLGTAVFSGMLGVTLFGIFLTPVFFYVIQGYGEARGVRRGATRRIALSLLGGLAGAAIGWALSWGGFGALPWGPVAGGSMGLVMTVMALSLRQRIARRRSPEPPSTES
jgi:multidrug efflux pump